jgi:uncharacterized protein (TIGR02996 family)
MATEAPSQDEQSFLTAILAAPDDDTPRLVFADWLDERGTDDDKARAALIRTQCAAELLPPGSPERRRLDRQASAIVKANEKRWLKDLRAGKFGTDYKFRRGFLDGVSMSPTKFIKRGGDLLTLAPTLRSVRFPYAANEVTELAASPFLARIASADLTLMCTCGFCGIDEELRDLFKSKHAHNLRALNISRDRVDAEVVGALVRSPNLANLTELDLSDNPLGGDGLAALAKAKNLGRLTALTLSRVCKASSAADLTGFQTFARSKHFPALKRLTLEGDAVNAVAVTALVAAPFFPQLTHLDLSHNRIGEQGAKALAGADTSLETLDLSGNALGARGIKWLRARFGDRLRV